MSTGYTRVTITAGQRNVETLLPSDRPVGSLMPELLRTTGQLGEKSQPQALTLTPVGSGSLLSHQSLNDAKIRNGSVLSLDRLEEAAPRPLVYDLAEESVTFHRSSPTASHQWQLDSRRITSSIVFTILVVAALRLGTEAAGAVAPEWWSLGTSAAALLIMALLPRQVIRWDTELLVLSLAALMLTYWWGLPEVPYIEWAPAIWAAAALLAWQAAHRVLLGAAATLAALAVIVGLWWGTSFLTEDRMEISAVAGVGSALLLGLAPRMALGASGMNSLDDGIAEGKRPTTIQAHTAMRNAHHGLAGAVALCATSLAVAVHGLTDGGPTLWGVILAALLTLLTALRARSVPLPIEQTALLASAALGAVFLADAVTEWMPLWLLVTLLLAPAAVAVVVRVLTVPEHRAAQLRINARRLETLATVALIPVALGIFGIYADLTQTFQD